MHRIYNDFYQYYTIQCQLKAVEGHSKLQPFYTERIGLHEFRSSHGLLYLTFTDPWWRTSCEYKYRLWNLTNFTFICYGHSPHCYIYMSSMNDWVNSIQCNSRKEEKHVCLTQIHKHNVLALYNVTYCIYLFSFGVIKLTVHV